MSTLSRLTDELCPDGVSYNQIGTVVEYQQPSKYIVKSTHYNDEYLTPVLTAGQSFILGYTNERDDIFPASIDNPVIIFDDFTGAFKWVDFPFKVKSSAMKILTSKTTKANLRYIYHIMGKIGLSSSEHKRLWISMYSKIDIPIPPLEIQEAIVRILDNFTELSADLSADLSAELSARKKQYEHYRESLITSPQIPRTKLSEIASIKRGVRVVKSQLSQDGPFPVYQNSMTPLGYFDKSNTLADTAFVISAGAAGEIGYSSIDFWAADDCLYITCSTSLHSKYLYYALLCQQEYIFSRVRRASVPRLSRTVIEQLTIPLPSYKEQERVVSILDQFHYLCNDLNIGLPAENELRRKQYEYYRDRLLVFKELEG